MGKVIKFREVGGSTPNNLIITKPWEFRWAEGESRHFIQMLKSQSRVFEQHRREVYEKGNGIIRHLPLHFILTGSMAFTIQGLYHFRGNEEKMRDVYMLAGLIDCMIHQVTPLLRPEAIRDMYSKIRTLKSLLNINWFGAIDQVLLPLDPQLHNESEYRVSLSKASTMNALYHLIREGTGRMFDILSLEYVFYIPGRGP